MTIKFLIEGTPDDPTANPIPYTRTTQALKYSDKYKRYQRWCDWVRAAFLAQNPDSTGLGKYSLMMFRHRKPILLPPDVSAKVDIKILWKNKATPDGDNVYKGILDALFINDKHVKGSYDYALSPDKKGAVEVQIEFLYNNEPIADNLLLEIQNMVMGASNDIVRALAAKKFKALSPTKNEPTTKTKRAKGAEPKKDTASN